jgi:hypothetical protein
MPTQYSSLTDLKTAALKGYQNERQRVIDFLNKLKDELENTNAKLLEKKGQAKEIIDIEPQRQALQEKINEIKNFITDKFPKSSLSQPEESDSQSEEDTPKPENRSIPETPDDKDTLTDGDPTAAGEALLRMKLGINDKKTLEQAMQGKPGLCVNKNSIANAIYDISQKSQALLRDASQTSPIKKLGLTSHFQKSADTIKTATQSFFERHRKKIIVGAFIGLTALAVGCCFIPGLQPVLPFVLKAHVALVSAYHATVPVVVTATKTGAMTAVHYAGAHTATAAGAGVGVAAAGAAAGYFGLKKYKKSEEAKGQIADKDFEKYKPT